MVCPLALAVALTFWRHGMSAETASERPTIHVYIFLSEDCDECKLVKKEGIAKLAARLRCRIIPHYYDADELAEYKRLVVMAKRYGHEGGDLPIAFLGKHVLSGVKEIKKRLEELLAKLAGEGGAGELQLPSAKEAEAALQEQS